MSRPLRPVLTSILNIMDIKEVFNQKGLTFEQVASRMKPRPIKAITLSQTIHNNPSLKTLQRIAEAAGCKVGDFFRDEITSPAPNTHSTTCPHCGKPLDIIVRIPQDE